MSLVGPIGTRLKASDLFPNVVCELVVSYATHPALEKVFQTEERGDAKKLLKMVGSYLPDPEKDLDDEKCLRNLEKLLTDKRFDKQIISCVNKVSSVCVCDCPGKKLWTDLFQQLLYKRWKKKWRLNKFIEIDDHISYYRGQDEEDDNFVKFSGIFFKICLMLGSMIYHDLGINSLEIDLFQIILFNIADYYKRGAVVGKNYELFTALRGSIDAHIRKEDRDRDRIRYYIRGKWI